MSARNTTLMLFMAAAFAAIGAGPATADTVAYWDFPEADRTADSSGNGHTLATNGISFRDGSVVLTGNQGMLQAYVPLSSATALTVECFAQTEKETAQVVIENSGSAYSHLGAFLIIQNSTDAAGLTRGYWDYVASTTAPKWHQDKGTMPPDGKWHHVAVVIDPSAVDTNDILTFYIDYVEQTTESSSTITPAFLNDWVYIGYRGEGAGSAKLVGELDDLRICGVALHPTEFLYHQGRSDPPRGSVIHIR